LSSPHIVPLTIHDIAFGGSGVARAEGKVWFVPFTIPGEQVQAREIRAKKKFVEAELVSVEQASPHRVEPRCPVFGRCGGCTYQHIEYAEQVALKQRQVEQTIRRVGRLEHVPMRPTVAAPESYAYRNRIRVHAEGGAVGFYGLGSHQLIDVEFCPIATPAVNEALAEVRRNSGAEGDYVLSGRGGGNYFVQTNDAVAQLLVQTVRDAVLPGQKLLVDAYCGAGMFARALRDLFPSVIGIEENVFAVEQAQRKAKEGERYISGDVAANLGEVLAAQPAEGTTVVLDPPAAGVAPRVIEILLGTAPAEIIYVSCDPATLARDLGALCRSTYRLEAVTPLDMFPQTAEIEVVAHLRRSPRA
jgi:tRNA/tmRNA/rRNA uracil-C5-methylase (TrmA/RlmC/RlmD family)